MHTNDTNTTNKDKIIYADLSYKLGGMLFFVHNNLGRFCKEKQYQDMFEEELKKKRVPYEREKKLFVSEEICGNQVDFCIDNKVLIDFKAKRFLLKEDYYQMKRYLTACDLRLGLVVNFRDRYLKPKRILN